MTPLFWIWFAITLGVVLIWASRHRDISRAARTMPPLEPNHPLDDRTQWPALSLLVAAKDEAANIDPCLRSLLAQDYPDLQVIAIDDRSQDQTPDIMARIAAASPQLIVHRIHVLPEGWFGKNHAMHVGVADATGEWLCFTDADCEFISPQLLRIAMQHAHDRGLDFLSILPAHHHRSFWERVIQPALSGIMMLWFSPLRVNDPRSGTAYANGAFMLIRRDAYDAIGGHAAFQTALNEDMQFARKAKQHGLRLRVVNNRGLYTVRMYTTLRQIWKGWTRIYLGCFETLARLLLSLVVVLLVSLSPWVTLIASAVAGTTVGGAAWLMAAAAAIAGMAQWSVMFRFYPLNSARAMYGLLYPLAAVVGAGALVHAILKLVGGGSVTWRGTTYAAQGSDASAARPASPSPPAPDRVTASS